MNRQRLAVFLTQQEFLDTLFYMLRRLLTLLFLSTILLLLARKELIDRVIQKQLSVYGFQKNITYEIERVSLTQTKLRNITAGSLVSIENATISHEFLAQKLRLLPTELTVLPEILPYLEIEGEVGPSAYRMTVRDRFDRLHLEFDDSGRGDLLLDDFSIELGAVEVNGISTRTTFDKVIPLSTPPHQRVKMEQLTDPLGLLKEGELTFQLVDPQTLLIEEALWPIGTGRVYLDEVVVNPQKMDQSEFPLEVERVALSRLFPFSDLQATGSVSGVLPLTVREGSLFINRGTLATNGPGVLRYIPASDYGFLKKPGMDLVLLLLSDFHYDSLVFLVHSASAEEVEVRVEMKGRNPEFEKGRPVHFNITLRGNFLETLDYGIQLYDLPETLMETIQ